MANKSTFKNNLIITTTLAAAAVAGYGRRAYAIPIDPHPNCILVSGSTYKCSGTATQGQLFTTSDDNVYTVSGFSASGITPGWPIRIMAAGALTFTDNFSSTLTGDLGVFVKSTGDSANPGSVTIHTTGTVGGTFGTPVYAPGIYASGHGTGAVSVTTGGNVSGQGYGINAYNMGTTLTVITGDGTTVSSVSKNGIQAVNHGSGPLTITANSDVSAGGDFGIYANSAAAATVITANGDVTGKTGIYTLNNHSATSIDITTGADSTIFGHDNYGIRVKNYTYETTGHVVVTTGAGGYVFAKDKSGIWVRNASDDYTEINTAGDVYGGTYGIYASIGVPGVYGTSLTITTGADTTVHGGSKAGIFAKNRGGNDEDGFTMIVADSIVHGGTFGIYAYHGVSINTGSLSITTTDTVTGDSKDGIRARNNNQHASVTVSIAGDVTGHDHGLSIYNSVGAVNVDTTAGGDITGQNLDGIRVQQISLAGSTENASLTVDGNVTGHRSGISVASSTSGNLSITVGGDSTVTGQTKLGYGSGVFAMNISDGHTYVTVDGKVSGFRGVYAINGTTGVDPVSYGGDGDIIHVDYVPSCGAHPDSYGDVGDIIHIASDAGTPDCGKGLIVTTGDDSTVAATNYDGIIAVEKGTGTLTINAGGVITAGTGVLSLGAPDGGDPIEITGAPAFDMHSDGIRALNKSTHGGNIIITTGEGASITGQLEDAGIYVYNPSTTGSLTITNSADATVISALGTGVFVATNNGPSGSLTNEAGATISGFTGIHAEGKAFRTGGIINYGTIEGTGGTAIDLVDLTASTPIVIYGGQIFGNVVDNNSYKGFSPVTIAGDFTSEDNFDVSDFNVSKGAVFTMGAYTTVTSFSTVNISGTVEVPTDPIINGDVSVETDGLLDAAATLDITGDLLNNGTITFGSAGEVSAATMSAAKAGTLSFVVNSTTEHGLLTITDGPADLTGQTITVDASKVSGFTAGEAILIVDGTDTLLGGSWATPVSVEDNSPLWKFKIVDGLGIPVPTDDGNLYLIVQAAATDNTPNDDRVQDTLDDLGDSEDPQIQDLLDALGNAETSEEYHRILESTQPDASGGAVVSTLTFIDNALNLTGQHIADVMNGVETGASSGSAPNLTGQHVWAEASGQMAHQGFRDHVAGFEATLAAMTVGMDTENLIEDGILGATLSYGKTLVNSNNANHTDTVIGNYQLTLYGNRDLGDGYYVNGMLAAAINKNTTLRHNVGFSDLNAHGEFDSHQFAARAEGGRAYKIDDLTFTPIALMNYVYYSADNYTETGAGGDDLTVTTKNLNLLELGLGGRVAWNLLNVGGGHSVPELHASYRRDMIGDKMETSSTFTGGGSAFTGLGPDPAVDKLNLGAQLKYSTTDNIELTVSYDLDIKKDFASHTGLLRAGYKF